MAEKETEEFHAGSSSRVPEPQSEARNKAQAWKDYETVFTNAKAGMDEVDKDHVKRIVYEMSQGSAFFKNEQRKEAVVEERISRMKAKKAALSDAEILSKQKTADTKVAMLEATRDLDKVWFHVDMDAFYAAVETLDNPEYAHKPMAVGGMSMLSTANYVARRYGVRAAMPGFIAKKLCPDLILVKTNFAKYTKASELTRQIFRDYDPDFIAGSLDEAFLHVTPVCQQRQMSASCLAEELRRRIREHTNGLTCSVGIACNRRLAKVCSDINKPNGQFELQASRLSVLSFVSTLPCRKINGIGRVTERVLASMGITTCGHLLEQRGLIGSLFSPVSQEFFLAVGLGLGATEVTALNSPNRKSKSVSTERTFSALSQWTDLKSKCEHIARRLVEELQQSGLKGRSLTLKLKDVGFKVRTRAVTLNRYTQSLEDILPAALKLLKAEMPISARLMGLRLAQFRDESGEGTSVQGSQKTLAQFLRVKSQSLDTTENQGSEHGDEVTGLHSEVGLSSPSRPLDVFEMNEDDTFVEILTDDESEYPPSNHDLQEVDTISDWVNSSDIVDACNRDPENISSGASFQPRPSCFQESNQQLDGGEGKRVCMPESATVSLFPKCLLGVIGNQTNRCSTRTDADNICSDVLSSQLPVSQSSQNSVEIIPLLTPAFVSQSQGEKPSGCPGNDRSRNDQENITSPAKDGTQHVFQSGDSSTPESVTTAKTFFQLRGSRDAFKSCIDEVKSSKNLGRQGTTCTGSNMEDGNVCTSRGSSGSKFGNLTEMNEQESSEFDINAVNLREQEWILKNIGGKRKFEEGTLSSKSGTSSTTGRKKKRQNAVVQDNSQCTLIAFLSSQQHSNDRHQK